MKSCWWSNEEKWVYAGPGAPSYCAASQCSECCTPHLLFVGFLSRRSGHRDKAAGSKKTFVSTFSADYLHCLVSWLCLHSGQLWRIILRLFQPPRDLEVFPVNIKQFHQLLDTSQTQNMGQWGKMIKCSKLRISYFHFIPLVEGIALRKLERWHFTEQRCHISCLYCFLNFSFIRYPIIAKLRKSRKCQGNSR